MALFANDYLVRGCCNFISIDGDGSNTLSVATEDLIKSSVSGAPADTIGVTVGTPNIGEAVQTYTAILIKIPPCGSFKQYVLQGSVQVTSDTLMTSLGFAVGEAYPSFMGGFTGGVIDAQTSVGTVLSRLLSTFYLNTDIEPAQITWSQGYHTSGFPTIRRDTDFTPDEILSLDKRLWGTPRNLALSPSPVDSIGATMRIPVTYTDNDLNRATANVVVSISACGSPPTSNSNTNTVTLSANDLDLDVCCEADSINPALIAIQAILANTTGDGVTITSVGQPLYGNAQVTANGITYQSPPCGSFPAPPKAVSDTVLIIAPPPPVDPPVGVNCTPQGPWQLSTIIGSTGGGFDGVAKTNWSFQYVGDNNVYYLGDKGLAIGYIVSWAGQTFTLASGWEILGTSQVGQYTYTKVRQIFTRDQLDAIAFSSFNGGVIPVLTNVPADPSGHSTLYLNITMLCHPVRDIVSMLQAFDVVPVSPGQFTISEPQYDRPSIVFMNVDLFTETVYYYPDNPITTVPAGKINGFGQVWVTADFIQNNPFAQGTSTIDGLKFSGQDGGFITYLVMDADYYCTGIPPIQVG